MTSPTTTTTSGNVTIDGYVLPAKLVFWLHVAGFILGAVIIILPTVDKGFVAPTSLGELAQYLGGSSLSLGTLLSLIFGQNTIANANAKTVQTTAALVTPSVINEVGKISSEVLPSLSSDLSKVRTYAEEEFNKVRSELANEAAKLTNSILALPTQTETDINGIANILEKQFPVWFRKEFPTLYALAPASGTTAAS